MSRVRRYRIEGCAHERLQGEASELPHRDHYGGRNTSQDWLEEASDANVQRSE